MANAVQASASSNTGSTTADSYLAKTEPKGEGEVEEIGNLGSGQYGGQTRSNQVGSPSSSSPVVSQQSVIQTSPSLENSISQGHQSPPVVPLPPEAPAVTVNNICKQEY